MDNAIAIVGMSCRFAGVSTPAAFWDAISERRSMMTVPRDGAEQQIGRKNLFGNKYPARIGQLGELYSCVPSMQNFPRQVNAGENQDLYFATQLAFDALIDAAMKPHANVHVRGSVRLGYAPPFNASTVNWLQHTEFLEQMLDVVRRLYPHSDGELIDRIREKLGESLPAPNAASFLLGSGFRVASWIARECSFEGMAETIDAGCLSAAVTLGDAMADLESGKVDVALAGALCPPLSRAYLEVLSGEVEFSQRPEIHPFAQDPDGTLPGEGGAFFVLKRRADALRDHDRIYALVKGVAIGHNREDDPASLIVEAAGRAGVEVKTIGLIEADGSGIKTAEERELLAIQRLWGEHTPGAPLVGVGSVKGNIGHTLQAAMAAGVVKTALALKAKVLPPQVAAWNPSAIVASISSGAYLLNEMRPWITGDSGNPRRAAVLGANFDPVTAVGTASAVGRAGVIILEEEPEDRT